MIGQLVSHYRISEKIGRGGMGEIYLADDVKLERRVALKFLPMHLTVDKEACLRFEREAKAAAALNHPNIVTVYEIGDYEGQVFIAMEYVEGKTLKEMISGHPAPSALRPMPISQVLDIALQIASGLAAAHAKGIVHRDIKPQNIMVDGNGRVKILDFGLAKLKGASPLTKESFAYGTVHYMSPEQALGKDVDARTDIWSLGAVLYEMLAGAPPFHGEYDQAVIYAIVNEETPPLPAAARQECPGLAKVIQRCLAKKRQERYPAAEEMSGDLRDLHMAGKDTRPEAKGRRVPSQRAILAVLPLLTAAILGFIMLLPRASAPLRGLMGLLGLSGIPRSRHIAVLPLRTGGGAEAVLLADGFTAVIIDKLTWLEQFHDSLWTIPASDAFPNRGRSRHDLQRLWGCNLFISGDLRAEHNSLSLELKLLDGRSGRRLRQVEAQGNMANLSMFQEGLLPKLLDLLDLPATPEASESVNTGGTSMPGAYILYLKGRGALRDGRDEADIDRGIGMLEKALQQDDGYVLARLALLEARRGGPGGKQDPRRQQKAEDPWSLIRQAAKRWAPAQLARGRLLKENGLEAEAKLAFQRALELDSRCYEAQVQLARSAAEAGNKTEAESLFKKAIRMRPGYPKACEELAYFYHLNGRFDEALLLYRKISELTPGDPVIFCNLGGMHYYKGELEQAKAMFIRSNAIQPNVDAQSNLATIYFYEGEYRKALPLLQETTRNSTGHYQWGNLADTYRQLPGFAKEAAAAYRQAIVRAEALHATAPEEAAEVHSCLGLYYAHLGEKQKALAAISRSQSLSPASLGGIRRAVLAYEAIQERGQALSALREYLERLGSLDDIEREPDLAALRRDPAYRRMIHEKK